MRRVRPHMQWTEAWLDTVDGIEDRCRDQRDDAAGDVWTSPRFQNRGVHHTDPLHHWVSLGGQPSGPLSDYIPLTCQLPARLLMEPWWKSGFRSYKPSLTS